MTLTDPITELRSALRTWTWGGFKAEWMYYRNNQNLLLLESILLFLEFTKSSKHPLSPGWDIYVDFIVNWKRTFPQCRAWVMTKKKKKLNFYSYSHIVRLWTQKHYFKRLITFLKNKNKKRFGPKSVKKCSFVLSLVHRSFNPPEGSELKVIKQKSEQYYVVIKNKQTIKYKTGFCNNEEPLLFCQA